MPRQWHRTKRQIQLKRRVGRHLRQLVRDWAGGFEGFRVFEQMGRGGGEFFLVTHVPPKGVRRGPLTPARVLVPVSVGVEAPSTRLVQVPVVSEVQWAGDE